MSSSLYTKSLYLNKEIDYILNCEIREYDLKSAGLSISKQFNLLPKKTIFYLENMGKEARNVEMGMLQKDKGFAKALSEGFIEARKLFFEANDLEDYDVLSIKKDAIFIVKKQCTNNVIGHLEFRVKNEYLGYMLLNRNEFYYKNSSHPLDVKGLGKDCEYYHGDYMLDFIHDIFSLAIYAPRISLIKYLTDFISDYRNNRLAYGYYRHLDETNFYDVIDDESGLMRIIDVDDNEDVKLDITYNYFNYLVPIVNIFI